MEELKNYIRKTKKESKSFYKQALEMLTENELEIIKLRNENEQLKENQQINNSISNPNNISINYQNMKTEEITKDCDFSDEEIKKILEENKIIKCDLSDKETLLEQQKNTFNLKIQQMESRNRLEVSELENQIYKLKCDIENLELEKNLIERNLDKDSLEKNNMVQDLETFNQIISNLEEQKERNENNYKVLIENLKKEKKNLKILCQENTEMMNKMEKEIIILKENEKRIINEGRETLKKEKIIFEKEIKEMRNSIGLLNKEKDSQKKEIEAIINNFKSVKADNVKLRNDLNNLNHLKSNEIENIKEKYETIIEENIRRYESLQFQYEQKISELNGNEEKNSSFSSENKEDEKETKRNKSFRIIDLIQSSNSDNKQPIRY